MGDARGELPLPSKEGAQDAKQSFYGEVI